MWQIQSTARLLKETSQSTEPNELVRLSFDYIRQSIEVQRALVLSRVGLSTPQYRMVHNVDCINAHGPVVPMDALRQGGFSADLLYRGEFQNIPNLSADSRDPVQ